MMYHMNPNQKGINPSTGRPWRTKAEYPYSYDAFMTWASKQVVKGEQSCNYSDRLRQWDGEKYNRLCRKHFDNQGDYWYLTERTPAKVEAFLRDYHDAPELHLQEIWEGCNVANGFPVWHFMFITKPE